MNGDKQFEKGDLVAYDGICWKVVQSAFTINGQNHLMLHRPPVGPVQTSVSVMATSCMAWQEFLKQEEEKANADPDNQ